MAAKFRLEIVTPQKQIYSGEVESLRVSAYDGSLGVLANVCVTSQMLQRCAYDASLIID